MKSSLQSLTGVYLVTISVLLFDVLLLTTDLYSIPLVTRYLLLLPLFALLTAGIIIYFWGIKNMRDDQQHLRRLERELGVKLYLGSTIQNEVTTTRKARIQFLRGQQTFVSAFILVSIGLVSLMILSIEPFSSIIDSYNIYLIFRALYVAEQMPTATQFYTSNLRELNIMILLLGLVHLAFSFLAFYQTHTWKKKSEEEIVKYLKEQGKRRLTPQPERQPSGSKHLESETES
ncbi:MAG: hypothetical protein ACXACA_01555 [Candidatus Ranarchaeia archaeon]|jgi:hypothetical protein